MPRFPGNKLPTSPAIRAIEQQMGFDHASNPPSLFDLIGVEQLKDKIFMELFLRGMVDEATLNRLKRENNLPVEEEPEAEAVQQPKPVRDQTIASPDMPTATNLATLTLRQV